MAKPTKEEIEEYKNLHNNDEVGLNNQWTFEDAEYHLLLSDKYYKPKKYKPVKVSKYNGKKGWKNESVRHSLARKGIKTGRKSTKRVTPTVSKPIRKDDLDLKNLGQYRGTEGYHNVMGAKVTDGVGYIMQNGYSWFVTDAIVSLRMIPELKNEEFVVVKLKVKDKKAVVTMTDGNEKILYTQKYDYTNAKTDLTLYYQNGVLLLSGEY